MTATAFYSCLEARGVRLLLDPSAPSGVRAIAPRGVVTEEVAARIRAALPRLRPLLVEPETHPSDTDRVQVAARGLPVELLEQARAGVSIPPADEWVEPTLLELARASDDAIEAAEEEQAHADAWCDALDWLETLKPIAWPKSRGVVVPDVARWLRLAGEERNRLHRRHGAGWRRTRAGASLVADLDALRVFLVGGEESPRVAA